MSFSVAGAAGDDTPRWPTPEQRAEVFFQPAPQPPAGPVTAERAAALVTQDGFDVTHYLLDLNFDDVARRISGAVTVTARSLVPALSTVPLDLAPEMQVSLVTRNGAALAFSHAGDVLTVTLDNPVANGQSFTLVVTYAGTPVQRPPFDGFGWNKLLPSGGRMAWSLSQPYNARIWWPAKDRPDDKALVEEWWTVKPSFTATGNGKLQGIDILPSGRKRFRWKATHPLATYLVSVAATDYVTFSHSYTTQSGGTMPIDYYVYSEDLVDARESFRHTPNMIAAFANLFGEYPFIEDKYGMSAFPFNGGMEHATNTSYGYERIDGAHGNDFVVAHELAHQWWGDSVTPSSLDDIWLSEGFASYAEALWRESRDGPPGLTAYMRLFERESFPGTVHDPIEPFSVTTYDKGAWVLQMLRRLMGSQAFFEGLRAWHQTYRDSHANTAQFQATMESVHGASLEQFFQQWVYGEGMPAFLYGHRIATPSPGLYHVWVRVVQVQGGPVFVGPLDITVESTSGAQVVHGVWNDSADEYYRLVSTVPVSRIYFDQHNWLLKSSFTFERPPDSDGDGVPNGADNCPAASNANQADIDDDLRGDACDNGEICNDGVDDDGDTLADCADPECVTASSCIPEDCDDGIDNDRDGDVDCADDECNGTTACIPEDCDDAIDNNADGLVDCADPDCAAFPGCVPETCDDGLDNDADGFIDCADDECAAFHGCIPEVCDDAIDNDGDGDLDCADDECAAFLGCIPEVCNDAIDNDGDGATDCADSQCVQHHTCIDEICNDGIDNDADGLTDCADEECVAVPSCRDEICNDGIDNDADGQVDCADPECAAAPGCSIEDCDDGVDNDGDGLTDCVDAECLFTPQCTPENCANGFDDDDDGLTDCADDECADFLTCRDEVCNNGVDDNGDGQIDCADDECADFLTCRDEVCNNGIDDNGDGQIDCADDECADFLTCRDEVCNNGVDDNGDGQIDCADDECADFLTCRDEVCNNGVDDNGDGQIDCADDECADFLTCRDEVCNNGVDDNGDGQIDCADDECADFLTCRDEVCNNGVDDNGDGQIDCADDECADFLTCRDEICNNGIDDNGDGDVDCADDECADFPSCLVENCSDGIDNDGDGLTDCNDAECLFAPVCTPEMCANGFDDDEDGLTDCADPECVAFPACVDEDCDDGVDNDGDGATDCADDECVAFPACIDEDCDDGVDNDGDGATDCADDECVAFPACIDEDCDDGVDNDGDGATDCADDECVAFPACGDESCDDGVDNDGDGATDCADDDCADFLACIDEDCDDGVDNDGDGAIDCADPACAAESGCALCPLPESVTSRSRGDATCFEVITAGEGAVTHLWTAVPLPRSIADPIVIAGPPSRLGNDHGVVQLRDVGATGFSARYKEWLYLDGIHTKVETFAFLAVPAGRQVLANGTVLEAGRFDLLDSGWGAGQTMAFATPFAGRPALFLTVQSSLGSQPVAVRAWDVTPSGFTAALFEEEQFMNQHGVESVGYLAVWAPTGWGELSIDGVNVPFLLQEMQQNQQNVPVLSWNLRYDEEQSFDEEYIHAFETISVLALGPRLFAQDVSTLESDVGTLRRLDTDRTVPLEWGFVRGVTTNPVQVPLTRRYTDPVVIVKGASGEDLAPGVVRIDGVAEDRFRVRFQEWAYLDGVHAAENLFYLVVEAGSHEVSGLAFEAGTLRTDSTQGVTAFDEVTFGTPFGEPPIVFSAVQTLDDTAPVTSRTRSVTAARFLVTLQHEEASAEQHGMETIGWVAFEPGLVQLVGRKFQITSVRASDRIETFYYPVAVSRRFPVVVADLAGFRGFDPACVRLTSVERDYVRLFVQEEASFDEETLRLSDDVSLFVGD